MRLLRYRAPIAHSCSPNESILGAVLGVRDDGVYHLESEKKRSAWDCPCVWVSVATIEGAESLEHAQRLSDALHAIGVQHEIR